MMQIVPKWSCRFILINKANITIYVHETHLSNVFRVLAGLSFDEPYDRVEISLEN